MKVSTSFGDELPVLLERIERQEQSTRIRAVLFSLAPVALAVALIGYTASSVQNAQKQVDILKAEASTYTTRMDTLKKDAESSRSESQSQQGNAENYKNQVTQLQAELAETQKTLSEAVNLS